MAPVMLLLVLLGVELLALLRVAISSGHMAHSVPHGFCAQHPQNPFVPGQVHHSVLGGQDSWLLHAAAVVVGWDIGRREGGREGSSWVGLGSVWGLLLVVERYLGGFDFNIPG